MRLTSKFNQIDPPIDVPVLRVCFQTRFVLLRKPNSYRDLVQLVQRKFDISDEKKLLILTESLNICCDETEIDEEVYELIAGALDDIKVTIQDVPEECKSIKSSKKRIVETDDSEIELASDSGIREADKTLRRESEEADKLLANSSIAASDSQTQDDEHENISVQKQHIVPVENLFDDEVDTQTTADDDDGEEDEEEEPESSSGRTSWEDIQPKAEPSSSRDKIPARSDAVSARANVATQAEASRSHGKFKVPVKRESLPRRSLKTQEKSSQESQTADSKNRFKVFIRGPESDHRAEFSTRGGHLVKKVLQGACRTFGLDAASTRLVLMVQADEDDEAIPFPLDNEESMARAGVEENAELVVEIVD